MATHIINPNVGDRLTATNLGLIGTAINNIQDSLAPAVYNQTKTGLTWPVGGVSSAISTSWATSNGFTNSGNGVSVPFAGTYLVSLYTVATNSYTVRTFTDMIVDGVLICRTPVDFTSGGEQYTTLTTVTPPLAVGQVISPNWYRASGAAWNTNSVSFRINLIPNLP